MGYSKIYKCPHCNYEIELMYGIGFLWGFYDKSMFYPPLNNEHSFNVYNSLSKNMLKEIHSYIESSEYVSVSNVYYHPYKCEFCGNMESNIYFEIDSISHKEVYAPTYECQCGGRYKKIHHNQKNFYCPKCKTKMIYNDKLRWD